MKWLGFGRPEKKRPKEERTPESSGDDDTGDILPPVSDDEAECSSGAPYPKRRSVSGDLPQSMQELQLRPPHERRRPSADRRGAVDRRASSDRRGSIDRRGGAALGTCHEGRPGAADSLASPCSFAERRASCDRRTSFEAWQEARRARNSMDNGTSTISTDKLSVCKAGQTVVINKTYIAVKALGAGTFGRVMLCFNVYDQRLYAIKACRKSQFAQNVSRYNHGSRLRRHSHFGLPSGGGGGGGFSFGGGAAPPLSATRSGSFGGAFGGGGGSSLSALAPTTHQQQQQQQQQHPAAAQPCPHSWSSAPHQGGGASAAAAPHSLAAPGAAAAAAAASPHPAFGGSALPHHHHHHPHQQQHSEALLRVHTEELVREIAILKKLAHPNIVNLVEVVDDPTTDSLLLVMDYVEGGTLEPRQVAPGAWVPLPEADVWQYVREVLQGLEYLHSNRVVHGDLKPANLLLDTNSGRVKIADFGSSITAGSDRCLARNAPGFSTPAFRSPESLVSGYQPSFEMDMWAVGVCIYQWVFGTLPFVGAAPFIIYEKIRSQDVHLPDRASTSPALRDLLAGLLNKDATQRLDVRGALGHAWVTRHGALPLAPSSSPRPAASSPAAGGGGGWSASGASGGGEGGGGGGSGGAASPPGGAGASGVEVSEDEIANAIRQIDGGLAQVIDWVFEEVAYADGEYLVAAGDTADRIFLVASGEVEVLVDHRTGGGPGGGGGGGGSSKSSSSALSAQGGGGGAGGGGGGGAAGGALIEGVDAMDVGDLDVFDLRVSDVSNSPSARASLMFMGEVLETSSAASSSYCSLRAARESRRVLAIKGAGDSLGLPCVSRASVGGANGGAGSALCAPVSAAACARLASLRWACHARARGPAVVFTARIPDLWRLVEAHPEMERAVVHLITQQETDLMVAEAMQQLHLFNSHECEQQAGAAGVQQQQQQQQQPPSSFLMAVQ